MLISTETLSLYKYGDIYQILKLIKDTGFDAYDFTMYGISKMDSFVDKDDYMERATKLRSYADSIHLLCNQTHSFYPTIKVGDEDWNKKGLLYTLRSIEISGILGAKYIIIHPCNNQSPEENKKMYDYLLPTAKKAGVKIALENMWNRGKNPGEIVSAACSDEDNFNKHLNLLDNNYFSACLDIGHAEMYGLGTSAVKMIYGLNSRLTCLHIHDNDLKRDLHKLPFTYNIDFDPIIDALVAIDYQGDITFEANTYPLSFPIALYPSILRLMKDIGEYFRTEIKKRKKLM